MALYADGYLLPIPKKNVAAYRKMAQKAGKIWREHGALQYFECVGEDLKGMKGLVAFPKLLRTRPSETVVLAWIVYKSRAHRDRVNDKVMKDPRMHKIAPKTMPFDMHRMVFGGFSVIVKA